MSERAERVFDRPESLSDVVTHYCPGCIHGIVHRLIAGWCGCVEYAVTAKSIGVAARVQEVLRVSSAGDRPVVGLAPAVGAHDEDLHAGLVHDAVVDALEEAIEPSPPRHHRRLGGLSGWLDGLRFRRRHGTRRTQNLLGGLLGEFFSSFANGYRHGLVVV